MEYGVYTSIAALFIAIVAHAVKVTWTLSKIEKELRYYFDAQIDNVSRDVTHQARLSMDRADTVRHEFGETASALRTKVHDVETWNRDTFVRKDSFEIVISRIEKSLDKLGDRFDEKLDKLVEKIAETKKA